jgi:FlaA1/EpsC-like NDP-sugar epimerase
MGASKALAERVVEARGGTSDTRFAAVRFGNVLGSSGSVLPIFQRQIEEGGPVTVTHAEMTRFFMTIPEAVQLVIAATGIAEGGDIFVLDMGEPVRIIDLARRMIELSGNEPGHDIAIEVVGIRPGEKLHEELFNVDEEVRPTRYGKIMRATRPTVDPDALARGLDELARRVATGVPEPVAQALWSALRSGRGPAADGEASVAPTTTTNGEHQ